MHHSKLLRLCIRKNQWETKERRTEEQNSVENFPPMSENGKINKVGIFGRVKKNSPEEQNSVEIFLQRKKQNKREEE